MFPELLIIPVIVHQLGETLYGIFILGWSLVPIFELLRMGVSSGLVKYSAEYFERHDTQGINRILSTACLMTGILGAGVGVIILLGINIYPGWLTTVSPEHPDFLKFTCNAVALMIISTFPIMPYAGILHALQRYDIFNLVVLIFTYIRVFSVIGWFYYFGASFEALIIVSALGYFLSNFIFVILARRMVPTLKNSPRLCDKKTVKLLTGFGSAVILASVCTVINVNGVKWLVGIMISPAFVGILAIIYKPAVLLQQLVQGMSLSMMPAASKYASTDNLGMLQELLVRGTRYITILVIMVMIEVIFVMPPLLNLWLGAEYRYLSPYIIVMTGGMALWMTTSAAANMMQGVAMLKESVVNMAAGPVITTIGVITISFLMGRANYWSVVIGYVAGYFVSAALRIWYCHRKLKLNLARYLWHAYAQPLSIATGLGITFYYIIARNNLESFLYRQALAGLFILIFIFSFLLLFFTPAEKQLIGNIRNSILHKIIH